jgi:hypothetical protein
MIFSCTDSGVFICVIGVSSVPLTIIVLYDYPTVGTVKDSIEQS